MVTVNRDLEASHAPIGWDPYEVWYLRVRSATLQLAQRQRARESLNLAMHSGRLHPLAWTRSKKVLVRVLQTTSLLCV